MREQAERGFTLLELVVVCLLIGIMLTFSIPSLRMTFFSDPLKSTARNLIGLANGVRELAVRHQQPYLLHISESEKRIWYERDGNGNKEEEADTRRENEIRLPETVSISGIWIGEDGSSEEQTVIWISKQGYMQRARVGIEDEEGNQLIVQFFPFLDSVTVTDGP
jgi:prepilin-type N-terminal cleavage/methylation domain-containing protein